MSANSRNIINISQRATHYTNVHVKSQNSSHPTAPHIATAVQAVIPLDRRIHHQ